NVLLALGSTAACSLAPFNLLAGHRKIALIQFYHPFQRIPGIPVAHRFAELVHHRPYRLVTLQPQLLLYLVGRETLLGAAHQEHGFVPDQKGQLGALHDRTAASGGTETASFAFITPFAL